MSQGQEVAARGDRGADRGSRSMELRAELRLRLSLTPGGGVGAEKSSFVPWGGEWGARCSRFKPALEKGL